MNINIFMYLLSFLILFRFSSPFSIMRKLFNLRMSLQIGSFNNGKYSMCFRYLFISFFYCAASVCFMFIHFFSLLHLLLVAVLLFCAGWALHTMYIVQCIHEPNINAMSPETFNMVALTILNSMWCQNNTDIARIYANGWFFETACISRV